MSIDPNANVPIAIAGLGAVGKSIAFNVDESMTNYRVAAVSVQSPEKHGDFANQLRTPVQFVRPENLNDYAEIVIECAPASIFRDIAAPVVSAGKSLIVLSVGALLDNWDLVDLAADTGATIRIPSGALLALDAVQAAAQGEIFSVQMVTRKPLAGLVGAPHLEELGISLQEASEPKLVFTGTARQASEGFPANLNVAVALALAGIGPDRTYLEVWADPTVERNTHRIEIDSDAARLEFQIENIPTSNAATGRITALSVIALLRKISSNLQVGT